MLQKKLSKPKKTKENRYNIPLNPMSGMLYNI